MTAQKEFQATFKQLRDILRQFERQLLGPDVRLGAACRDEAEAADMIVGGARS